MNDTDAQQAQGLPPPSSSTAAAVSSFKEGRHAVRVVLLASGSGSDANTYMPNRSSTQWWNRRDALVRCVAAFLFGPASSSTGRSASSSSFSCAAELVLLFDQDWSRMRMSYTEPDHPSRSSISSSFAPSSPSPRFVPTEQSVIRIWKQCCQRPHQTVSQQGFRCTLVKSSGPQLHLAGRTRHDKTDFNASGSSKRELLELLQSTCPLDFLKAHRLNSSPQVLLRKVNKDQLLAVHKEWLVSNKKKSATDGASEGNKSSGSAEGASDGLDMALRELLRPAAPRTGDGGDKL
jgi:hypothetical protein